MAASSNNFVPAARLCPTCGGALPVLPPCRSAQGRPKYCSRGCTDIGRRGPNYRPPGAPKPPRRTARKHGHSGRANSPTYTAWHSMKQRCLNPNNDAYPNYGARGITVCERWLDFANFLEDMGERPDGLTIDRIDPEGGYEPGNCRWATMKEQCNNWRRGHQFMVVYKGAEYTLQELADKLGLDRYTLRTRILRGRWPEELWHLPPNARTRPSRRMDDAELFQRVSPRGSD